MRCCRLRFFPVFLLLLLPSAANSAAPLHQRIDTLIAAAAKGGQPAARADDATFLRRVYLDFAGRIPSLQEARAFLADSDPSKRAKLIDRLLAGPEYPRRMRELFNVMLMERLGEHPAWNAYLETSFAQNKPWDQMVREILRADPKDEDLRGAQFFLSKRLEHYGQNPVDYPALTRDVGRLFLGVDLGCAQCHDHLFVTDYKQAEFQGLFAFFQNTFLQDAKAPLVGEKPTTGKVQFMSVFRKVPKETGPKLPGGEEITIPTLKKGEVYLEPADRKKRFPGVLRFSPLRELAKRLPRPDNPAFTRNSANRLWFLLMGRGLVHPLDMHHSGNPPSHPELLDLLAREFVAHKFDIKWLFRELALSHTYQQASVLPEGQKPPPPEQFLVALERRLSPEQLMWSIAEGLGERERLLQPANAKTLEDIRQQFIKAFANAPREPEEEFNPSLKAALFVLNGSTVQGWLQPRPGNLIDRLSKLTDADAIAEELYLSVLTRPPTVDEKATVAKYLEKKKDRKVAALGQLAWALLASTEFSVNH
jgi:hypothetical protein